MKNQFKWSNKKKAREKELRGRQSDAMSFALFLLLFFNLQTRGHLLILFTRFGRFYFHEFLISFPLLSFTLHFAFHLIFLVCMWWLKRSMMYFVSANWKNLLSFQRIFTYFIQTFTHIIRLFSFKLIHSFTINYV